MIRTRTSAHRRPAPGPADRPPYLRVVRGDPTPEELAALVAVLAVRARAAAAPAPAQRHTAGGWRDRRAVLGAPLRPGPGAWRTALR